VKQIIENGGFSNSFATTKQQSYRKHQPFEKLWPICHTSDT